MQRVAQAKRLNLLALGICYRIASESAKTYPHMWGFRSQNKLVLNAYVPRLGELKKGYRYVWLL